MTTRAAAASAGCGFLLALVANLAVALAAVPIAGHWNARGGEEWSVGLVLGAAGLTGLVAVIAATRGRRWPWALGLVVGAVVALVLDGAVSIWWFAVLHGS